MKLKLVTEIVGIIHLVGIAAAIDALFWTRSAQGAIAWCISLVTFPYLALPCYAVFGRRRFKGYRERAVRFAESHRDELATLQAHFQSFVSPHPPIARAQERAFEAIAGTEFTSGNTVKLLVDGEETFQAMFAAIDAAEKYILLETFILRDDNLGRELQQKIIARARAGVAAYILYDEVGSKKLPDRFVRELESSGVRVSRFGTQKGLGNFFQLNFRNHRKVIIVDGRVAFVGGQNIGDEYYKGSHGAVGFRDTHVRIEGPVLLKIQSTFFLDWHWGTGEFLKVDWNQVSDSGSQNVLALASGPTDDRERCSLFFSEAISSAKRRVWISSPYFVPDEAVVSALQLAALRGVDVRILLPRDPDHYFVWLASFFYIPQVCSFGARVFHYPLGFLHGKVVLVDDDYAAVGSANLDHRSFRLNFEIMVLVADNEFVREVAAMFERDFEKSVECLLTDFGSLPLRRRLLSKFARLLAPVL